MSIKQFARLLTLCKIWALLLHLAALCVDEEPLYMCVCVSVCACVCVWKNFGELGTRGKWVF